jgi:hypothetical protein
MSKTPDLAGAIDAMKAITRGPRKKSPVSEWLSARYDGLSAAFRERPASWKALADYLGDGGVLNAEGQRPTASSVRSAWIRLEAEMIRKRGGRRGSLPSAGLVTAPAPSSPVQGFMPGAGDDDENLPDFSKPVRG